MAKKEDFLRFLFTVLFGKQNGGFRRIWRILRRIQKTKQLVIHPSSNSHGIIYLHPLSCLSFGILEHQQVRLTLTITTVLGDVKVVERIMVVRINPLISSDNILISKNDMFNLFRGYTPKHVAVESIIPTCILRSEPVTVLENAKLSRIKTLDNHSNVALSKEHLDQILKSQTVFYKNDVIRVVHHDHSIDEVTHLYYRLDCTPSPCIIDSTTSIYETAAHSTFLPFANFTLHHPITLSMKSTINRMTDIYFAHKRIQQTPLTFLISGASGSGKRLLCQLFASTTHRNFLEVDAYSLVMENTTGSESKIDAILEKANSLVHCVLYVRNAHVLAYDTYSGVDRKVVQHLQEQLEEPSKLTIVLSCISDKLNQMPIAIRSIPLYNFSVNYLEEEERATWLSYQCDNNILVNHVAKKTNGFTLAELEQLLRDVEWLKVKHQEISDQLIYDKAIDKRNSMFADAIGAPKIPNVKWSDVGGLEETKRTVVESIRTNLFGNRALKRSGIILFGAPGCGKTLIAKAVATEFNIAFLSVKGPELLNKYVGQSEENLRKVFERAKQASPCVIFFDEIDSLAPNRGKNGDSGGVIDRIVSQLLAELDKLHNSPRTKVFVMGATNRPDLLDTSLMTPGRFDKMVEVKAGNDVESKTKILEAISRKMNFDKNVDLREIASLVDDTMSGAQLFSIISNAAMQAIIEKIKEIESGSDSNQNVQVAQRHLIESVNNFHSRKI